MLEELVLKNRSYRGYDESVRLSKEQLIKLLNLARNTPSSMNGQALKYLISYTDETNAKIFPNTMWAGKLKELHLPYAGHHPTAYIVIFIDQNIAGNSTTYLKDVGIAAQTILLGATEMGLGGIMIGSFNRKKISEEFHLSDALHPELVIALGKPDETIILEDAVNGNTVYYRDNRGYHHVPKRLLDDLLINE